MTDEELILHYSEKHDRARNSSIGQIEIKCADLWRILEMAKEGMGNTGPSWDSRSCNHDDILSTDRGGRL